MRGWLFDIRSWVMMQTTRLAQTLRRPFAQSLMRFNLSLKEHYSSPAQPKSGFFSKVVVEMEIVAGETELREPLSLMPETVTSEPRAEIIPSQPANLEPETQLSALPPASDDLQNHDSTFSDIMSEEAELSSEVSTEIQTENSSLPLIPLLSERSAIQSAQNDTIFSIVNGEDGLITVQVRGESMSLVAALESLLFVADTAVETSQFVKLFSLPAEVIEAALDQLGEQFKHEQRGIRLQMQNGRYRLVSAPAAANLIESFLNLDLSTRLSAPALEALSVIAYRQPVTRAQIEAVRGVDCGHVLRSLLQRGLIEESGRLETVGRPILYSVTEQFMQHFGLTTLDELPPLETTEAARLLEVTELVEG